MSRLIALMFVLLISPLAHAQSLSSVAFNANPNHGDTFLGNPVVTRYDLVIETQSPPAPFVTVDLGKPTPVSGQITVSNVAIPQALVANTAYIGKIVAVGPGGSSTSPASSPFGVQGPPGAQEAPSITP